MKDMSNRSDIFIPEIKNETNLSSRLAHALEIIHKVLEVPRLDKEDRLVFARNLGSLYEDLVAKDKNQNFSRVLVKALGEEEAESLIKKRKTLILCSGEKTTKDQQPQSRAHRYWLIAKVLCEYLFKDQNNLEALSALNLIKGSSFDFEGSVRTKFEQAYVNNLNAALSFILRRVKNEVDLEWMYEWTKDHEVNASCVTGGVLEDIEYPHELSGVGLGLKKNFLGNEGAPSLSIAETLIPVELQDWAIVGIPLKAGDMENRVIRLKKYLLDQFYSKQQLDTKAGDGLPLEMEIERTKGCDSYEDYLNALGPSEFFNRHRDVRDWEARLGDGLDEYLQPKGKDVERSYIYVRMYIDFEIRFVEELAGWQPTLVQRVHKKNGHTLKLDYESKETQKFANSSVYANREGKDAICLWRDEDDAIYAQFHGIDYTKESGIEELWQVFKMNSDLSPVEDQHLLQKRFIGNASNYFDFAFEPIEFGVNQTMKAECLVKGGHKFVDVPEGSVAGMILRNLAYADEGDRIDNLLIQRAKENYSFLKKIESEISEEYRLKIESLYHSARVEV